MMHPVIRGGRARTNTPSQASLIRVAVRLVEFRAADELDSTFGTLAQQRPEALVVMSDAALYDLREPISALALKTQQGGVEALKRLCSHDWLVWEPGQWRPARAKTAATLRTERPASTCQLSSTIPLRVMYSPSDYAHA